MQRRNFLRQISLSGAGLLASSRVFSIAPAASRKPLKIGFITDLHHLQFGVHEDARMKVFMDAVMRESPDFILQCGDFCRPVGSDGIMAQWNRFKGPKYHVLGNHDMDVCDKATIMKLWGMEKNYYSFDTGGYHFIVMDRNFLKQSDGKLTDYNNSNWSPFSSPFRSFTDEAQLEWLKADLAQAKAPSIVFMHQPVFLSDWFTELGNAADILQIFDAHNLQAKQNGANNAVTAVFMGHDHDDRYGERNGVHYFIMNSASYVYTDSGAHYYKDPLFAFLHLDPAGTLRISGMATTFRDVVPDKVKARFPTTISHHTLSLKK
ncbi:3',5'-cyclic AMP phosphodiesterase CpdA [Chitinophaga dinghuensis]|uniref:3',5'-cyclic AMP phosphodiesterase CpdA n=1 Tax=Chitinophaga dinghuensis TaxID=1539050 RepID=A0A327VQ43_9BACT|nr:metallophosphoesterase [Chitinophaga dinghuensis]RAJ76556.1 3',5'-cyclic AMP phosphodiesterase CpdA [Chitinophaga dinghuensis]